MHQLVKILYGNGINRALGLGPNHETVIDPLTCS